MEKSKLAIVLLSEMKSVATIESDGKNRECATLPCNYMGRTESRECATLPCNYQGKTKSRECIISSDYGQ